MKNMFKLTKFLLASVTALILLPCSLTSFPSAFASENQIEVIIGDYDNNGIADLTDLTSLCVFVMSHDEFKDDRTRIASDIDRNGTTDIADLARMKQYVSKDALVRDLGKCFLALPNIDNSNDTVSQITSNYKQIPDNYPDLSSFGEKQNIFNYINNIRTGAGLSPYTYSNTYGYVCDIRAEELTSYFDTVRENNQSTDEILSEYGIFTSASCTAAFKTTTYEEIKKKLNENIDIVKDHSYKKIGIGYYRGSKYHYWFIVFTS